MFAMYHVSIIIPDLYPDMMVHQTEWNLQDLLLCHKKNYEITSETTLMSNEIEIKTLYRSLSIDLHT